MSAPSVFAIVRCRSSLTLAALIVLGCADKGIAPRPPLLTGLNAPRLADRGECTVSWLAPVSGMWSDAARWSTGAVPGASDEVCITVDGTYTVTVRGSRAGFGLRVGAEGNTGVQTLLIQGVATAVNAILTVDDGIENRGVIRLRSDGNGAGNCTLIVTNGVLYNHASGLVEGQSCSAPGVVVNADVVNDGTFRSSTISHLTRTNGRFVNNGAFIVDVNCQYLIENNHTFVLAAGTLDNHQSNGFIVTTGTFQWDGGVITDDSPWLNSSALVLGESSTGQGTVIIQGSSTTSGNVQQGQTVHIRGVISTGAASLTASAGFSNFGTIRLQGAGNFAGSCSLVVTSGVLRNEAGGLIEALGGCGSPGATVSADVVNDGTFRSAGVVQLTRTDGRFVNNATFIVDQNTVINLDNNQTFVQAGGTLTNNQFNGFVQTAGTFQWDGGVIAAQSPWLNGSALVIGDASTATGTVIIQASATLTGDVKPGQVIHIRGILGTGAATLTTTGSLSNHGTIRLQGAGNFAGACNLVSGTGVLTNATDGRIETFDGCGVSPTLSGEIINVGNLYTGAAVTQISAGTLRHLAPGTMPAGNQLRVLETGTLFVNGAISGGIRNHGQLHIGQSPGLLSAFNFIQTAAGTLNIELDGTQPGVEFDRMTLASTATLSGTLNVTSVDGTCADPGVYEIMTFSARGGDFAAVTVNNLGAGQTLTRQPGSTNYRVTVTGGPCTIPDATPPLVTPSVVGTLGNNGWYVSNVSVTWDVTDAESAITSKTGCDESQVTDDTAGITFTCSATSAGGTTSQSVTIRRDATAPAVSASRAPAANADGWNNTDVTATYSATDAMSGVDGGGSATQVFSAEGENQAGSRTFADLAGNSATAQISGISIDKTAPAVSVSRQPPPDAEGWNTTAVTVIYSATDVLSGVLGDASFTQVFANEGTNQGGSREFADRAGNAATATITGINIRQPPPPPPLPFVLACSATPAVLQPLNGQMVPVAVTIQSATDLTGATTWLHSATSNEPNSGPGPDIQDFTIGTNDLNGLLRAARYGSGHERRYTLVYGVRTANQQKASCSVIVRVAPD